MNQLTTAFDLNRSWGEFKPVGAARIVIGVLHALPASRTPFYSLGKLIRGPLKRALPRVYDVQVFGLALRLLNRGNYCETTALFSPQFYDVQELEWVSNSLQHGDVFVDVGANVGLYSLITAKRRPNVSVYAIEPDPLLANRMQFNARNNGLRVQPIPVALSNYEGSGTLKRSDYQSGGNQLTAKNSAGGSPSDEMGATFDVTVTTLHSLCNDHDIKNIATLKIDIEGHESKVLSHFFEHAAESLWPRNIVIEKVHDAGGIVAVLIRQYGYALKSTSTRNVLLVRS